MTDNIGHLTRVANMLHCRASLNVYDVYVGAAVESPSYVYLSAVFAVESLHTELSNPKLSSIYHFMMCVKALCTVCIMNYKMSC